MYILYLGLRYKIVLVVEIEERGKNEESNEVDAVLHEPVY